MAHYFSSTLYDLGGFIVALGILVFVHEFGHYSVARWFNIKVLRFSVGFGPVLWSRRRGPDQTEWTLSAIPLGGYVRMVDEREGEVADADLPRAFNRQPLHARAAVVAAGPLTNLLLAVVTFALVGTIGVRDLKPFLNGPAAGSPAAQAGILAGDRVHSVNGEVVSAWSELQLRIATRAMMGSDLQLEVEDAQGRQRSVVLPTTAVAEQPERDPADALGLRMWNPSEPARIGELKDGGAAQAQGLRTGDEVLAVNGQAVKDWESFVRQVQASPGQPLALQLRRAGQPVTLTLTPATEQQDGKPVGRIGAYLDSALRERFAVEVRYGPVDAVLAGLRDTRDVSAMILRGLGRLLTGHISVKSIGGPVQIATAAGETARHGIVPFLKFLALISINLGILNLLPIPVLDGGHLLYYSFELISGRPLPERLIAAGTRVGLTLLLGLMALAFYNDINRFFSG